MKAYLSVLWLPVAAFSLELFINSFWIFWLNGSNEFKNDLFSLSQNLFKFSFLFFFLHKGRGPLTLESKYFVSVFVKNIQNWVKVAKIGQKLSLCRFLKICLVDFPDFCSMKKKDDKCSKITACMLAFVEYSCLPKAGK